MYSHSDSVEMHHAFRAVYDRNVLNERTKCARRLLTNIVTPYTIYLVQLQSVCT